MRRRSRGSGGLVSRRTALFGLGAGLAGAGLVPAGAFESTSGDRGTNVVLAQNGDALVGLYVYDQVAKNSKDPLVDVTNNYTETLTVTVTLIDCTEGTLYAPDGSSDSCSISGTVVPGSTGTWKIESNVGSETIVAFDVSVSAPDLSFGARRSTTAVNKASTAVTIKKYQLGKGNNPAVDTTNDQFNIKDITIQDNDGDADVDRRTFTVTDGSGNTVSLDDSLDDPDRTFAPTAEWNEGNITLQADENLSANETYNIKLTGYDVDGNRASDTKSA